MVGLLKRIDNHTYSINSLPTSCSPIIVNIFVTGFAYQKLNYNRFMGIEDPKLRLFMLLLINLIVIVVFRNWVLNNEAFVWLLNGLPSWSVMEAFDSTFLNIASSGFKPLITLTIFAILGSFSWALMTFLRRGDRGRLV